MRLEYDWDETEKELIFKIYPTERGEEVLLRLVEYKDSILLHVDEGSGHFHSELRFRTRD